MTLRSGLHIHPHDGIGTSAQDARMALAGLVAAAGVLDGLTVTGTAGWQYRVAAGHVATTRGIDTDGVVVFANDAPTLVDCTPSPGTGARIDIIYAKHNDAEAGDSDNLPVLSVAEGIASGTPNPPDLPVGAIEIARATVGAGSTSTSHANVTISHADQARSVVRGSIVTVANDAQRDATYNATDQRPIFAWRTDTQTLDVAWGEGWKQIYPPVLDDTGWQDLDRGQGGYYSAGKYRVKGGWACLNVDLTCASNRPSGTVEIAPANSAYAHTGNSDMRGLLYSTTDGSAYPARVFPDGKVNAYALPSMSTGDRIYGTLTFPVG